METPAQQGSKNKTFNELGQNFQGFSNTQMIPLLDSGETPANPRLDEVEFNSLVAAAANQGRSLSQDSLPQLCLSHP